MKSIYPRTAANVLAVLLISASTAFAQAPNDRLQQLTARFAAADKDHDGRLTLDEAKAGMPKVARNFDKIDTEHHGYITLEQLVAFAQK